MTGGEFHALAVKLATGTPAEVRTSISRSYYAVFHVGAETLRGLGFSVGKGAAAHGEVLHCLTNSGSPEITTLAFKLSDLHSWRNQADYQLDRTDVEQPRRAQMAARDAAAVMESLHRAFRGPDREQLRVVIQAWRKANGYP